MVKVAEKIIQKVLLLRALVGNQRLLLLEEPFEGIEDEPRRLIIDYLLSRESPRTMLISCNDIDFASQCDKVIFLENGRIKTMGTWRIYSRSLNTEPMNFIETKIEDELQETRIQSFRNIYRISKRAR